MSEIDAIFSGKPSKPTSGLSSVAGAKGGKKKASGVSQKGSTDAEKRSVKDVEGSSARTAKGKQKAEEPRANGSTGEPPSKKRKKQPPVDEVFDPSAAASTTASSSSTKTTKKKIAAVATSDSIDDRTSSSERGRRGLAKGRPYIAPESRGGAGEDDSLFADSRGAIADSKRKRTEEGYRVLTEEELGLDRPDAGETDLCPFDCDCCY